MKRPFKLLACCAGLLLSLGVQAKTIDKSPAVSVQLHGNYVALSSSLSIKNGMLRVVGPNGYSAQKVKQDGLPSLYLDQHLNGSLPDGDYAYEFIGMTGPYRLVKDTINNGRGEKNFTYAGTPVKKSGHFKVVNGQIKIFRNIKEPAFR
jgi:hypothetical protein